MISYSIRCAHQFIRSIFPLLFFHLPLVCRSQQMYILYATLVYECQGICFTKINSVFFALSLSSHFIWLLFAPFFSTCFYFVIRSCFATEAVESNFVILQFLIDNIFQSFRLIPFTRFFKFVFAPSLSFSLWAVVLCTLCNVWHNLHVLQSHGNANCRNGNYCMNFSSKIYDGAPFDQWQI